VGKGAVVGEMAEEKCSITLPKDQKRNLPLKTTRKTRTKRGNHNTKKKEGTRNAPILQNTQD